MYEQIEKPKENKSRVSANSVTQKKSSGKPKFGFVDNRLSGIVQRKLVGDDGQNLNSDQVWDILIDHYNIVPDKGFRHNILKAIVDDGVGEIKIPSQMSQALDKYSWLNDLVAEKVSVKEIVSEEEIEEDAKNYYEFLQNQPILKKYEDMTREEQHNELIDGMEYIPNEPFNNYFTGETTKSGKAINFIKAKFQGSGVRDKVLTPEEHYNFQTFTFGLGDRTETIHLYRSLDQKELAKLKKKYGKQNFLDISTFTPQFSRGFISGGINSNKTFQIHENLIDNQSFLGRGKETKKDPESTAVLGREMLSLFSAEYEPEIKGDEFFMKPPKKTQMDEEVDPVLNMELRDRGRKQKKAKPLTKKEIIKIKDEYLQSLPEEEELFSSDTDNVESESFQNENKLNMVDSLAHIWDMDIHNPHIDYKKKALYATTKKKKGTSVTSLAEYFKELKEQSKKTKKKVIKKKR